MRKRVAGALPYDGLVDGHGLHGAALQTRPRLRSLARHVKTVPIFPGTAEPRDFQNEVLLQPRVRVQERTVFRMMS